MIKAVLFDMDGILYDSEGFYMNGTIDFMTQLGFKGKKEELCKVVGTTLDGTCSILSDLLDNRVSKEEIRRINDAYFTKHPLDYRAMMFEGIPEVLKRLKDRGLVLACCSSSPQDTIEDSLKAMGILSYFDFIESGENVTHPKPDPEIYLKAAKALGVKPSECLVYEDSTMGIQAGKRAGMKVIARIDTRFHQDQSEADYQVINVFEMEQITQREDL